MIQRVRLTRARSLPGKMQDTDLILPSTGPFPGFRRSSHEITESAFIHPPFANNSVGLEAQATGRIVVPSGQPGIHADGTIPPEAEAQTDLCLKNIEAILSEAHLSRDAIVQLNAYVVDRQHMAD